MPLRFLAALHALVAFEAYRMDEDLGVAAAWDYVADNSPLKRISSVYACLLLWTRARNRSQQHPEPLGLSRIARRLGKKNTEPEL